jgi:hypothetical protein
VGGRGGEVSPAMPPAPAVPIVWGPGMVRVQPIAGIEMSRLQPAGQVITIAAVAGVMPMKCNLGDVAAPWQPSVGVSDAPTKPNAVQFDQVRVVLAIVFQVVGSPAAGVVPEIVEWPHEIEPPPLTDQVKFVEVRANAVLNGSIVVADAVPATPQVATRASAEARPSFLRCLMRTPSIRASPSAPNVSRDTRAGLAVDPRP